MEAKPIAMLIAATGLQDVKPIEVMHVAQTYLKQLEGVGKLEKALDSLANIAIVVGANRMLIGSGRYKSKEIIALVENLEELLERE